MKLASLVVAILSAVSCTGNEVEPQIELEDGRRITVTKSQAECVEDYLVVSSEVDAKIDDAYEFCVEER